VITFAEDGLYWHLDHIGVHERPTPRPSFGADAPPLYYVTMQSRRHARGVEAAHAKGGAPPDSSFWASRRTRSATAPTRRPS